MKRLIRKFREKEHEKCDRLVELHDKYLLRVVTAETKYLTEQEEDGDDDDVLDRYRLDAGMSTLRSIALVIGGLCCISGNVREYLVEKLKEEENRNGVKEIVQVLESLIEEEIEDGDLSSGAQKVLNSMRALV